MRSPAIAVLLLLLVTSQAHAALFHRNRNSSFHQGSGGTLRKRLHVNDLIAEPGTVEVDFGGLYSYTTGGFSMPAAIKFTPDGDWLLYGRTEYSVAFDSVASAVNTGSRATQFSDRLTLAATSVVLDTKHFDIAIAPQMTAFLRNESGVRLGATVIARFDGGGNSIGVTAAWTTATKPSDTNPAGVWDIGAGYGRKLASSGPVSHFTPHANVLWEKSTGFDRTVAAFGGVEYQITERLAIDASGQRLSLAGVGPDRQVLLSMTVSWGKGNKGDDPN